MFAVFLRLVDRNKAGQFLEGHKAWLNRGFEEGVFVLAGGLQPNQGGALIVHNTSLADLQARVNADPFVAEGVVKAEILEITPSRVDERLKFLVA
jgi:uncharacterized protein YciI